MLSDIEIASSSNKKPIVEVAEKLGISADNIEPYGHYRAKISQDFISGLGHRDRGKLVLVTAISPTPAGEGKTTTTVGLGDAMNRIGKRTSICIREPSLGPVFGMKGGAAGGGYAQVVPMEDINLHFNGDFPAIELANNLLAALIDNHIHHGNELGIDSRRVTWRRVVDMNDRALRDVVTGLGNAGNGYSRQSGFDIVVASEVMAIFCLAKDFSDLQTRLGNIIIGHTRDMSPIRARDLKADGAMAVLLKQAFQPNLVQTLEHNPAFVHGGPFANIAHGCNSVIATQTALKLSDYVITEAGFGADLGAEKFIDIKCRSAGLQPSGAVLVATIRALKFHGGVAVGDLNTPNVSAVAKGLSNLDRHLRNITEHYALPCVVCVNHFVHDSDEEIEFVKHHVEQLGAPCVVSKHWASGGAGAEDLAHAVVELTERPVDSKFVYNTGDSLWDKMKTIATKIYGAADITANTAVRKQIQGLQDSGYGAFPVCVAKTQYSFSTDPSLRGAPSDHVVNIREVRLSAGAEFIVMVCGDIMTMPGLPKEPAAHRIGIDKNGQVVGLF